MATKVCLVTTWNNKIILLLQGLEQQQQQQQQKQQQLKLEESEEVKIIRNFLVWINESFFHAQSKSNKESIENKTLVTKLEEEQVKIICKCKCLNWYHFSWMQTKHDETSNEEKKVTKEK